MSKPKFLSALVLCLVFSISCIATVHKVNSKEEMLKALTVVKPGDEIVIGSGTYPSWELVINNSGTAEKPIIIRAESPGETIFSGEVSKSFFRITGSFIILSGFKFSECTQVKADGGNGFLVELRTTNNCRVTQCSFTGILSKAQYVPIVVISGKGDNNRIDHCSFSNNTDNQEVQVKITAAEVPLRSVIDNNTFSTKKKVSWANSNGGECVQIGQDPVMLGTQYSYTTVRDNRFVACNGEPEVISNKSSGNRYINNSFENCQGELVMRGGHDCFIDSNTFKGGTGGIRLNGSGHTVTNNRFSDLPMAIRLMYGMSKGKTEVGFYVAATDCVIKNNRISKANTGILIGDGKNADWSGKFDTAKYPSRTQQDVPPSNNDLSGNIMIETKTPIKDLSTEK